jgi:hypothetical protein
MAAQRALASASFSAVRKTDAANLLTLSALSKSAWWCISSMVSGPGHTVERAFASMLELVHRHAVLHAELQERMAQIDKTGTLDVVPSHFPRLVGVHLVMQIDDTMRGLKDSLPETRDNLLKIGDQLRQVLRMQFPARSFIGIEAIPERDRVIDQLPALKPPALWRRCVRRTADRLRRRPPQSVAKPNHSEAK